LNIPTAFAVGQRKQVLPARVYVKSNARQYKANQEKSLLGIPTRFSILPGAHLKKRKRPGAQEAYLVFKERGSPRARAPNLFPSGLSLPQMKQHFR
jgi:hypothetical protein